MPQMPQSSPSLDLSKLRLKLDNTDGPTYWRSLEELACTRDFREMMEREFPALASQWNDGVTRRTMLKLMGASLALLGVTGCFYKNPQGTIVPRPNPSDEVVPGRPLFFATAMPFDGYAKGVLAFSREGRPIKIEGNPDHPASLGATDVFMQASILDLYDPDRSRSVRTAGQDGRWTDFVVSLRQRLDAKRRNGQGLRLLTGPITSPTMAVQIQQFLKQYPGSLWHVHDPVPNPGGASALSEIFERPVNRLFDLSHAAVIVSFDDDFLFRHPGSVRYARQFIDGRRVRQSNKQMNRLYVVESTMTLTGSMADHRLAQKPSHIEPIVRALAAKVGASLPGGTSSPNLSDEQTRWVNAVAADLASVSGQQSTLVLAGESQPPIVHAMVHAINQKLGNLGQSVLFIDPVEISGARPLSELVSDMQSGKVDTLLIIGVNPAYSTPADVPFAKALEAMSARVEAGQYVNFTASLATHYDETSYRCQWHIPRTHYLESWGDIRAFDGTASIIQPLIAPLFGARSDWEFMDAILGRSDRTGLELVRSHWMRQTGGANFEQWWMQSLQKGIIADSTFKPRDPPAVRRDLPAAPPPAPAGTIEVVFRPDPSIWSGEFANNAWLQELPKPFVKLTWDNAIAISPTMAQRLGGGRAMRTDGDVIAIDYTGQRLEAPIVLLPGQADDTIVLTLGYGRTHGGTVLMEGSRERGYNAYLLRGSANLWSGAGAKVAATGATRFLAMTRNHHAMSVDPQMPGIRALLKPEAIAQPEDSEMDLAVRNRRLVRTATLQHFLAHPDFVEQLDPGEKKPLLSLYQPWDYKHGLQWGMTIDMTACIGCNACIIACQAENNIPVVGKEEVGRQREMHWIRIDNYFAGPVDAPAVFHQPVPCMQCENAPCEYVCPTGATTHSDEGLNEMTYNRCIGTRYCSNNCPYKVRRFNFFLYSNYKDPSIRLQHNPDVTVRSRGVMEKCTYCVQRIDNTRVQMEKEVLDLQEQARRATSDGERQRLLKQADQRGGEIVRNLQTACQQACPTRAIIFGDLRDAESDVSRTKREPTNYGLLTELTTKPRTTYLARITNPNPDLAPKGGKA